MQSKSTSGTPSSCSASAGAWPCRQLGSASPDLPRGVVEGPTRSLRAAEELEVQIADVHLMTS